MKSPSSKASKERAKKGGKPASKPSAQVLDTLRDMLSPNATTPWPRAITPAWLQDKADSFKPGESVQDFLMVEIRNFCSTVLKQAYQQGIQAEKIIDKVRDLVQDVWKTSNVAVFGSFGNGLWLPSSDVDLVITVCHLLLSSMFHV